ncbi:MAG: 3-hydroxyacyl-CoA dehydrogenase family protein [Deltaproteobacteria bacterium]|nr:3-hydroxyacyl-CoA dehydrogenase family protein [Candidatus Zymogenaceae bacterium]
MDSKDVKKVLVVGAGVMGHSIAQVFATAGIEVALVDLNKKALDHAMKMIGHNLENLSEFGRLDAPTIPAIIARIRPTTDIREAASGVDFALEAVVEVPDVKKKVFADLEQFAPPKAVLASNTSGLDIFTILEPKDPSRFVITHWFSPPHIIPLVEVAPGPKTDSSVMAFTIALLERLGKRPVVMRQFTPAFIVNRIQSYIFLAVMEILNNNWATPEEIDYAVKISLGIRLPIVGAVQTYDFSGLDLVQDMLKSRGMSYPLIDDKIANNQLGAKTGKGFFDYGGRTESEIVKERDALYVKMADFLEGLNKFRPV